VRGDLRAVRHRDGAHDGEPKSEAAIVAARTPHPLVAEPLERLEQPVDLRGRHHRPAVADPQHRPSPGRPGLDRRPAARHIVPDRVPDQVRHQALRQPGIALGRRRPEPGVDRHVRDHGQGHLRQVEGLGAGDAPLAARQRQQRVDQRLLLPAEPQHLVAGDAQRRRARPRVAQRHLQHRPLGGQRGAQLVGRVGDEAPLRLERRLQPREQVVQRVPEPAELVVALPRAQPPAQVGGGNIPRRRHHRLQRPEQAAGQQPAERERCHHRQRQADEQHGEVGQEAPTGIANDRRRGGSEVLGLADREVRDREHHQRQHEEHSPVQEREPGPERAGEHHWPPIR
jgi:hypothetical protein